MGFVEAVKKGNVSRHNESPVPVKIPEPDAGVRAIIASEKHAQPRKSQSRDQAGKAAGVNGRYVVVADNLLSKKFDAGVRAMVALNLKPHFAAQAKERQRELSGTRSNPGEVVEKIPQPDAGVRAMIANQNHPQPRKSQSRDQAGKAAGVNGRYVVVADNLLSKKFDDGVRAMVAQNLKPHFAAQAKERQRELSGTRSNPGEVEEKIPQPDAGVRAIIASEKHAQPRKSQSRDQAGKAAGVNGRYVDMAGQAPRMRARLAGFVGDNRPPLGLHPPRVFDLGGGLAD